MRADTMVTNVQRNDIEQFLHDVRQYFIASLDTSEYENTSNMFHLTEAEQTANLLHRCDALLAQYSAAPPAQRQMVKNALSSMAAGSALKSNGSALGGFVHRHAAARDCVDQPQPPQEDDATYLDMSAANTKQTSPSEAVDLNLSAAADKALRYANVNKGKRPEGPKVSADAEEAAITMNNSNNIKYNNNNNSNNIINNINKNSNNNTNNNINNSNNNNINNNIINNYNSNHNSQRVSESHSHHREDKVCSTPSTSCAQPSSPSADEESDDDERQVYDICLVSQMDDDDADGDGEGETQRVISRADSEAFASSVPCPYAELPAGHLAIQQSSKYGQLQRIEKRLFFDQSKKCYGGILHDWLLLYADGPTSSAASQTLHLKSPGVEIEHYGEGKRRDVCFQISTGDPNKRFVFQAANEVDAKEWIHAIEAAIRSDTTTAAGAAAVTANTSRKLPTPPTLKRMTFISAVQNNNNNSTNNHNGTDCIYEEPEHLYAVHEQPTDLLLDDDKERAKAEEFSRCFEYDVPKSPPQPVLPPKSGPKSDSPAEAEGFLLKVTPEGGAKSAECGTFRAKTPDSFGKGSPSPSTPLASPSKSQPMQSPTATTPKSGRNSLAADKALDFQAKVKDVHHKLSSQLSAGLSPDRYRSKKAYTQCANEMEFVAFNSGAAADVTPPKHGKDQKKPKKSDSPSDSPQPRKNSPASGPCGGEKSSKNWFLNRLNKSTSSTRNAGGGVAVAAAVAASQSAASKSPGRHASGEKENLLNSLETYEHGGGECQPLAGGNPASPILLKGGDGGVATKSKVNMIINQLEASGHLATMFSMDAFSSFCGGGNGGGGANDCNNYEPIMTMSTPPTSLMKKV